MVLFTWHTAKQQKTWRRTYTNPNGDNFTGTWLDGLQQTGEGTQRILILVLFTLAHG